MPLPLPPLSPRYDRESFLLAPSNETAWQACRAWLESGEPSLIICGPPGAGKTHLATIIAESQGVFGDWRAAQAPRWPHALIVFDDLPAADPRAFMTTFQEFLNAGVRTVLVGRGHPGEWAQGLKDLRTRLEAIPRATLDQPDEALLRAVMTKAFQDRQIAVDPNIIEYAARRLPRTFEAALGFAALADEEAARQKKKITVGMAKSVLGAAFDGAAP